MIRKILLSTSLKASIIANFAGNGWVALINLVFVPIYLKYLGAEGYGLIGIFASLQVVLSLLDSGLSTTLNKEMARLSVVPDRQQQMRNLVKTLGTVYWGVAAAAGIIAVCLSPLLARYWVHPATLSTSTITYAFLLLSASLMFQFPTGFYSGGLLGLQRQVMLNAARIIFATLKSVGAVLVLIFISRSILSFFMWNLFISILQAITMRALLWYSLPKTGADARFDQQELKNIWRFAAGIMGISLTAILLTQVDKIILSKILSLEQFGYYTVACTLGMMIYQVIAPLTQSYFPKFSNLISLNDIKGLKNLYHQGCQLISVLVLPATLILVFFSRELILIWTKSPLTADNTWEIAALFAYGTGLNGLLNLPYMLTVSSGWTKLGFYQNICLLVMMIPLTIFFALKYGAVGGALSWACINTVYFFVTPHLIHRKILKGEAGSWYWQDSLRPLLACIIVIAASKYFFFRTPHSMTITLVIIACTGILSVFSAVLFASELKNNIPGRLKKDKRNVG